MAKSTKWWEARTLSNRSGNNEIWIMDLSTTAVGPAAVARAQVQLVASPNPFRDHASIRLVGMQESGILRIVDVAGRIVRDLAAPRPSTPNGTSALVWDGRNASGLPVAPGTYFLTFESESQRVSGRVVRAR
jgi:hypothetical protein